MTGAEIAVQVGLGLVSVVTAVVGWTVASLRAKLDQTDDALTDLKVANEALKGRLATAEYQIANDKQGRLAFQSALDRIGAIEAHVKAQGEALADLKKWMRDIHHTVIDHPASRVRRAIVEPAEDD